MNILIVDDKQLAINALCRILRDVEPDSTCMKALSAQQALDEASRTHFDVVFLDIEMPGMNGIELAQKLKAGNESINIIFVTAHAEHALEAHSMYVSGFLLKPASEMMCAPHCPICATPSSRRTTNVSQYAVSGISMCFITANR